MLRSCRSWSELFVLGILIFCAVIGCSKKTQPTEKPAINETQTPSETGSTDETATISSVGNDDLSYLLNQGQILAESPLPHELPQNFKNAYRIIGITEQGNCDPICPRSTIFVTISNFSDFRDGHIRLYRISGIRFIDFNRVEEFKPEETNGYFLSFRFSSIPHPQQPEQYVVRVGFDRATVEPGLPGIPKPAYRFRSFFERKKDDVFRITFRQGDVFRLFHFQPMDPSVDGIDDEWGADVKEVIAAKHWKGVGGGIKMGFKESDVLQIFDEKSGRAIFKRELWEP